MAGGPVGGLAGHGLPIPAKPTGCNLFNAAIAQQDVSGATRISSRMYLQ
jgi:hypothetical protein